MRDPTEAEVRQEREATSALLRSHPRWAMRAVSISDCLKSRRVPEALKEAWVEVYCRNYGYTREQVLQ